jgi:hypothetical protein
LGCRHRRRTQHGFVTLVPFVFIVPACRGGGWRDLRD